MPTDSPPRTGRSSPIARGRSSRSKLSDQSRDLSHAPQYVGVRLALELVARKCTGEHADHRADSGIGSGLQIERRVADCHYLADTIDRRSLHRMEDQVRGRATQCDIVAAHDCREMLLPAEAAEDRP